MCNTELCEYTKKHTVHLKKGKFYGIWIISPKNEHCQTFKKFNSLGSPSKILIIAAKYVFTQILK